MLGLLEIFKDQKPVKSDFHYSYPWVVEGKRIGFLKEFMDVGELASTPSIRDKSGNVSAQPLQTVMPQFDRLPNLFMPAMTVSGATRSVLAMRVRGGDYTVEDSFGKAKIRKKLAGFRDAVINSCKNQCVVCGTKIIELLDAAHLSPYATDKKNRSNPANGLSICKYCHAAMDKRLIVIHPNGELQVSASVSDPIAELHFGNMTPTARAKLIKHADPVFLKKLVSLFEAYEKNTQA